MTLASPDIEIIGDAIEVPAAATAARASRGKTSVPVKKLSQEDEAALVRRFTAWAELMPNGRIEVEGARVHLKRRGDRAARNTFTLSQAVLIRGASNFNAFGTMLLSQDVGQSLFLSAKLEGLGTPAGVSGDLRLIARRVFLRQAADHRRRTVAARSMQHCTCRTGSCVRRAGRPARASSSSTTMPACASITSP